MNSILSYGPFVLAFAATMIALLTGETWDKKKKKFTRTGKVAFIIALVALALSGYSKWKDTISETERKIAAIQSLLIEVAPVVSMYNLLEKTEALRDYESLQWTLVVHVNQIEKKIDRYKDLLEIITIKAAEGAISQQRIAANELKMSGSWSTIMNPLIANAATATEKLGSELCKEADKLGHPELSKSYKQYLAAMEQIGERQRLKEKKK